MQVSLTEFLQLVKVVRMLYGAEFARQLFESTYKQFGFDFSIIGGKLELPQESNKPIKV